MGPLPPAMFQRSNAVATLLGARMAHNIRLTCEDGTMPVYAVFEPPMRQKGNHIERDRSDRFVFLREGFNLWAFLFGPLWMIRRRLWLVLIVYAAVIAGLEYGLRRLGIVWPERLLVYLLIELLVGIEAANLRAATLARRGWRDCGIVIADGLELAERRFFDVRAARRRAAATPPLPAPAVLAMPGAAPVIGLFPETG